MESSALLSLHQSSFLHTHTHTHTHTPCLTLLCNMFIGKSCALSVKDASFSADETCNEGAVHLVGGDDESRGRVLYCYNGAWYSVCADGWDTTGDEARVVCDTLGYNTSNYGTTYTRDKKGTVGTCLQNMGIER